jgi:hypothetical protein
MTQDHVNHSQVGNVFMLGAAGPFVVALAAYFGRYPVLFWFAVMALATAIWCTAAQSFESFMVFPPPILGVLANADRPLAS